MSKAEMNNNKRFHLSDFRNRLININRSFAEMEPLLLRTLHLSLNAEIASSLVGEAGKPFGIVVKELSHVGLKLGDIIKEVELEFSKVVIAVSKWIATEGKLRLFLKGYRLSNEGLTGDEGFNDKSLFGADNDDLSMFNDKTRIGWNKAFNSFNRGSAQYHLLENAIRCRDEIVVYLKEITRLTRSISGLLDRVNMVAVRQSHFVAVTAMIESVQVGQGDGHIKTIAEEIQLLSKDIHKVEAAAKDNILSTSSVSSMLFSQMN